MAELEGGEGEVIGPGGEGKDEGAVSGASGEAEEVRAGSGKGGGKVRGKAKIVAEWKDGGEGESAGASHHQEASKAVGGVLREGGLESFAFAAVEEEGSGGERESREGRETGVRELAEEGGVAAEEAEDGDSEAEVFLEPGERAGGEEAGRGGGDGVLEEAGGLDVGVAVDDVVETTVLDPLEPNLHQPPPRPPPPLSALQLQMMTVEGDEGFTAPAQHHRDHQQVVFG